MFYLFSANLVQLGIKTALILTNREYLLYVSPYPESNEGASPCETINLAIQFKASIYFGRF